jgi:hypothetical protein
MVAGRVGRISARNVSGAEGTAMTRPRDRGWLVLLAIAAAFAIGAAPYFMRMWGVL